MQPMLNDHQRRALSVALRLLEERLAEITSLMDEEHHGILLERPAPRLSDAQRAAALATMGRMREIVASLAARFDLERDVEVPERRIAGLLGPTWQSLLEVDSRHLRGYGVVDPAVPPVLDPAVEDLVGLIVELGRLLRAPAQDDHVR